MVTDFVQQYQRYREAEFRARREWANVERELGKLVRIAKLNRKASKVVPITAGRVVEIRDQFKEGRVKVFAPAFARRWKITERKK